MILGYGIDLVHLPRIASLIHRRGLDKLARRILSSAERDLLRARFPASSPDLAQDHKITEFIAVRSVKMHHTSYASTQI